MMLTWSPFPIHHTNRIIWDREWLPLNTVLLLPHTFSSIFLSILLSREWKGGKKNWNILGFAGNGKDGAWNRAGVPFEIVSKAILCHTNSWSTWICLGKVPNTEALTWLENLYA